MTDEKQSFERGRGLLLEWAHVGLITQFPSVSSYTVIRSLETSLLPSRTLACDYLHLCLNGVVLVLVEAY